MGVGPRSVPVTVVQPRQPRGVPVGGQYAQSARAEVTSLDGAREVLHHRPGLVELTPATRRVVDAITAAGGEPYLVGGCVRDAVLHPGRRPKDIDIEVYGLDIDTLRDGLATVGYVDEVGRAFSVLKIRRGGEDFDVSLPRRDAKTGVGHRGFEVIADPHASRLEASARRDFTINALMLDPTTDELVDCWGGLDDLESGILRHTTEAFADDPLRVLRGVQFAARFGFRMDPETADLCRSLSGTYPELSKERVWGEWQKIAAKGTHISAALEVLKQTGWEEHYPQIAVLHGVPQDEHWHPEGDVHTHVGLAGDKAAQLAAAAGMSDDDRTVVVLASVLHDVGKATHTQIRHWDDGEVDITSQGHADAGVEPAEEFLKAIDTPRHIRDRVLPLIREHMAATNNEHPSRPAVRRLARRLQPATISEWALVVTADKGGRGAGSVPGGVDRWVELAQQTGTQSAPVSPLLRGEHLIAEGMKPGPAFAPIMRGAMTAQDDGEFDDEPGAIAWLAARLSR